VVICLERGANLHMAQRIPLPLTVSCFSEIQIGFTFLVPAHLGSPGQRAVKWVSGCVPIPIESPSVCPFYVACSWPPCASVTSSIKLEIHNISQHRQTTEPRPYNCHIHSHSCALLCSYSSVIKLTKTNITNRTLVSFKTVKLLFEYCKY